MKYRIKKIVTCRYRDDNKKFYEYVDYTIQTLNEKPNIIQKWLGIIPKWKNYKKLQLTGYASCSMEVMYFNSEIKAKNYIEYLINKTNYPKVQVLKFISHGN